MDAAGKTNHPRDIDSVDLEAMCALSPVPQLLRSVVEVSRNILGFFPAHNPRALEYPWIVTSLPADLHGWRLLDVGAGVNVLPFMLADRGAAVVTVDDHPSTRDPNDRQHWNEWGFLDYALLDSRIASVRMAYESWRSPELFDAIYSVSVIEHVPRAARLAWIGNFRAQLKAGGLLLLTVDLVRDTNLLWNLSEGKTVEDPAVHGEFSTLIEELQQAGFDIAHTDIQRGVPNCRVDIGYIRAKPRAQTS
jgi:SAM-dependent methyltransferase